MAPHTSRVKDDEILAVFRNTDERFLTTQEVTSQLPLRYSRTIDRLNRLHEVDRLERKWVGSNATWWLPSDPDES